MKILPLFLLVMCICQVNLAADVACETAPSARPESQSDTLQPVEVKEVRIRLASRFPSRIALKNKMDAYQIKVDQLQAKVAQLEQKLAAMEAKLSSPLVMAAVNANQKSAAALSATLAIQFHKTRLDQVIQHYRNRAKISIYIDWNRLRAAGVFADTLVTLKLENASAAKSLQLVLRSISPTVGVPVDRTIEYALQDGVVMISTRAGLRSLLSPKK